MSRMRPRGCEIAQLQAMAARHWRNLATVDESTAGAVQRTDLTGRMVQALARATALAAKYSQV